MGILNITKDSFYDGGRWLDKKTALFHAEQMAEEGAHIIDIGGESSRPGADEVTPQEEKDRVLEVIAELSQRLQLPISIDTSKAEIMTLAASAGASLINDVRALRRTGAMEAASASHLPVCLMHMRGEPPSMQDNPTYTDVVIEVKDYLRQRKQDAIAAGIPTEQIIFDPGFGFGKKLEHNRLLLQNLNEFSDLGNPILVGLSRKSCFGELTGRPASGRLAATLASTVIAITKGAWIIRVHDVKENLDAIKLACAVKG